MTQMLKLADHTFPETVTVVFEDLRKRMLVNNKQMEGYEAEIYE